MAEPLSDEQLMEIRQYGAVRNHVPFVPKAYWIDALFATIDRDRERIADLEQQWLKKTDEVIQYHRACDYWIELAEKRREQLAEAQQENSAIVDAVIQVQDQLDQTKRELAEERAETTVMRMALERLRLEPHWAYRWQNGLIDAALVSDAGKTFLEQCRKMEAALRALGTSYNAALAWLHAQGKRMSGLDAGDEEWNNDPTAYDLEYDYETDARYKWPRRQDLMLAVIREALAGSKEENNG